MASLSAKRIATQLTLLLNSRVRRVRPNGSYRPKRRSLIINYGASQYPAWLNAWGPNNSWINHPAAVARASNKLLAFQTFTERGIACPEWTTSPEICREWRDVVVCRTLLNSHSGRGIVLVSPENPTLPSAPLYVRYKKKRKEFRVHVFKGTVIDITEKRRMRHERRPDAFDGYIRNYSNGWIFARDNVVLPSDTGPLAIAAVASLGLDFGACDIIWNEHENKSYVLEVNTAPGLEGTTLKSYIGSFLNWINNE